MPDVNDTVGELAIVDATLCDLLRDILNEAGGQNSGEVTTGQAADRLLAVAKADRLLFTSDVTDWLKRIKRAAEKRNTIIHAIARDRCVTCGQATRFEHKGAAVDRSPAGVGHLVSEFTTLINEGVNVADGVSDRLNERERARAAALAVSTGAVQTPRQVLIGQNWCRCAACSPTGVATVGVRLSPAVAVIPPKK
jgi:hypothetical protein